MQSKLKYLHRGTNSLAFRLITNKNIDLFKIIKKVGSLVAPSANPQGQVPAKTIKEAEEYFGKKVDFYINGGRRARKPSRIVSIIEGEIKIIRK